MSDSQWTLSPGSGQADGCLKAIFRILALIAAWHHALILVILFWLIAEVRVKFR